MRGSPSNPLKAMAAIQTRHPHVLALHLPLGGAGLTEPEAQSPKGERNMAKVQKSTDSSSLAEVVDRILDKGIVIDAWVKVSLVGIELLSVEARVVIASVETYLKYAEAIGLTASAAAPA
jgi:gas vesicle structural protein